MSHCIHRPPFPLSQHVELMWRETNTGLSHSRRRVYPNGAMALVIHLKEPTVSFYIDDAHQRVRVPLLAGPYSRAFHIDPSESTAVIGVLFRPGAARNFFSVAAHELHNTDISLSDLNASDADRLLNDVCSEKLEPAQFQVLERYLTQRLKHVVAIHPAVRYAVEELSRDEGVRIRQIQLATGLSHTRFIQLFHEHVGLTPKLFCRIRRFRMLLDRIEKSTPVNWAEVATDGGYFDQAHLIRDFRVFAGITPLEYTRSLVSAARTAVRG
jgi:AraC-like DNA-binding protein